MLELQNKTPYEAAIAPGLDKDGLDTITIVVKATFRLAKARALGLADEQAPIRFADRFHGEPGASSVLYEGEGCPGKRGTDVILVGHATANRPLKQLDVTLRAGPLKKDVRVFGDRAWFTTMGRTRASDPAAFTRLPLVYERAFGGADAAGAVSSEGERPRDPRNPVGVGYTSAVDRADDVRLPNLEDPEALVESPADRPPIAGFGYIGRDWLPRRNFAGTYDAAWTEERMPLLPMDFDDRYFNGAASGLITSRPFRGGEPVSITNVVETGELAFDVPAVSLEVGLSIKRDVTWRSAVLDTLLIEPDERRVVLTWRMTQPCPRQFLYVDWARVIERRAT